MKLTYQHITNLLCIICLLSCNKKPNSVQQKGFIKSISSDFEACVKSSLELQDGNYVLVCQDFLQAKPGLMVKLDPQGAVLWKKNLSTKNLSVWKILPLSHQRYVTFGVPDYSISGTAITACMYDFNGNLLSEKDISIAPYLVDREKLDAIQLSNGNFAIANTVTTGGTGKCSLVITDTAFNKLHTKVINLPNTLHVFCKLSGLCEQTDTSIALTAFTFRKVPVDQTYMVGNQTSWMIRTSMTGVEITNKLWSDTNYSESPNALIPYKDGLLSVSSRMLGFNNSNGAFVSYFGLGEASVSAKINLNRCNASGDIIDRTEITDYPRNGLINSIKKTTDGGYILCGTVNQSSDNSLVSQTKIYLLKLNQNLGVEWSKIIQNSYPAIGVDIFETTKGGFLVSGHQRVFNQYYEMLVIKTDAFGNIY